MRRSRRWAILATVLIVLAGGLGWWEYARYSPLSEQIPGLYTGTALDNQSTIVFRFSPDGVALEEVYSPGAAQPRSVNRSRWRLSGRILVLESGAAASAPVRFLQSLTERFERPILGNVQSRFRVASADESGLALDIGGGVTWVLSRMLGER
jgi:hypothetical protein